jgi:acetyl-CoA acetyltransferase
MTTSPHEHRDRCAIAGVGATDFSRASGRSVLTLATQASLAAIADAGLPVSDIDGVVRCENDEVRPNDLAESLGLDGLTYWTSVGSGGGAPCGMVAQAVGAILTGQATTVLVYRSLNGRSGRRFGRSGATTDGVGGHGSYDEFYVPYGLVVPGQMFSLIARRHMIEHGTTSEQLGHIALTCRENANANPSAQLHDKPLSMDDYLAARYISEPLRLNDFCLETDGACAVVVTAADRARDLRQPPALIRAVAQGGGTQIQAGMVYPTLARDDVLHMPSRATARTLYSRAGLGPRDMDVAQLYDCFTITLLLQLEDYAFCAPGEGGPFAESGAIAKGGQIPVNTAGGNLSEGYIHGLNHVVEGVRQIRGTSTSQVPGAQTCLVTSGLPVSTSAMILTGA